MWYFLSGNLLLEEAINILLLHSYFLLWPVLPRGTFCKQSKHNFSQEFSPMNLAPSAWDTGLLILGQFLIHWPILKCHPSIYTEESWIILESVVFFIQLWSPRLGMVSKSSLIVISNNSYLPKFNFQFSRKKRAVASSGNSLLDHRTINILGSPMENTVHIRNSATWGNMVLEAKEVFSLSFDSSLFRIIWDWVSILKVTSHHTQKNQCNR